MFVVLRTVKPVKGFFKRKKQKKIISNSDAAVCHTERDLPFFILDVLDESPISDWEHIAAKCGRYASRIIAPRNYVLPDHGKLKRFVPITMRSVLLFNTAEETIKKAGLAPENISVTVTDRNAVMSYAVCRLLPLASSVRIITSKPERYARICEEAFNEYGASLIIRSFYEPTLKPDIVICCDGIVSPAMQNAAVFTCKSKACGKIRFLCSGIKLLEKHKSIIPDEIDSVDFAGALTELCGSSEYKHSSFTDLKTNCSGCESPLPEECLKCSVLGKSRKSVTIL